MDQNGTAVPFERVGVGVGLQQGGAVAEIALGVAQRRQHQMQLLAVVAALAQRRGGLDEQHLAVGVLAAVDRRAELVGEQPQGSVVAAWLTTRRCTRGGGWDCDVRAAVGFRPAAGDPGSTAGCGAVW